MRVLLNNIRWGLMDEKLNGEEALRASGAPYTIVRPGGLTNQPGGKAKLTWSAIPYVLVPAVVGWGKLQRPLCVSLGDASSAYWFCIEWAHRAASLLLVTTAGMQQALPYLTFCTSHTQVKAICRRVRRGQCRDRTLLPFVAPPSRQRTRRILLLRSCRRRLTVWTRIN